MWKKLLEIRGGMMRVQVVRELCRGHARCLALAPDAFGFSDDDDQAFALIGADDLPRALLDAVVRACPEGAVRLIDGESGREN